VAVEVYGVDADYVQSFMPQISIGTNAPLTTARLTVIVKASAAEFNGLARRAGINPTDEIADDETTDLYANAQRLVFELSRPWIMAAAHGHAVVAADVEVIRQRALVTMQAFAQRPQSLGEVPTDVSPRVRSSTEALGLNTDDTARDNRRMFDTVTDRNGLPNDIYRN